MPRKLDKKRPFAEIYGQHEAKYEQFGILFDSDGVELPGYEDVEIPKPEVAITTGDDSALRDEIGRLLEENAQLRADLEEMEAVAEEATGNVDTLKVEVKRLQEQLLAAQQAAPAKGKDKEKSKDAPPAPTGEAAPEAPSALDQQLSLQDKA